MQQLTHLLDLIFAEKGRGKGRNANRVTVLALVSLIWWNTRTLPDRQTAVETRLAKVEARLGIASSNAVPGVAAAERLTAGLRYSSN